MFHPQSEQIAIGGVLCILNMKQAYLLITRTSDNIQSHTLTCRVLKCHYIVMPCFSLTSIVLYRVFDSKCNTILNNQWREQVQCQTLFVFLFCFTFHLNLNQLYKCPRVIMNNNMPICYFILHLFYMSRQIALTGYICMYCQWPKYSFFWHPCHMWPCCRFSSLVVDRIY